jgi:hypothetical protein
MRNERQGDCKRIDDRGDAGRRGIAGDDLPGYAVAKSVLDGNSIAHCDNRIYRSPLGNGDAATPDGTANGDKDAAAGADEGADENTVATMHGGSSGRPLRQLESDANRDGVPDADARTAIRDMPERYWLSSVLLCGGG